jgi:predicted transcriptional regulator
MTDDRRFSPDARPVASLTGGLLARRGAARPAMRRQAANHLDLPLSAHEDLGWNDIGEDFERPPMPVPTTLGLTPPDQDPPHEQEFEEAYETDLGPAEDATDVFDVPHEVAPPAPAPISPLTERLEAIAERIKHHPPRDTGFQPMVARKVAPRRTPARADGMQLGRKAAFTLRLDPERHLRLRLLSALRHRSSQQLLIEALDALLAGCEKVEDLAAQVERDEGAHPLEEHGLKWQA